MIRFNGNECGLCLLDTNAVSEMVKHPDRELHHYFEWASTEAPGFVPALTIFNLVELRHRPALYEEFLQVFDQLPCVFVMVYQQLVEEEVRAYPTPEGINPLTYVHSGAHASQSLGGLLDSVFNAETRGNEERWNSERAAVVEDIRALVANFPDTGKVRDFLEVTVPQVVEALQPEFTENLHNSGNRMDIDSFPSVKAIGFAVWHKYYADRRRAPSDSDTFDLIISSAAPYSDAIVTERNLAEGLRQTMRRDDFMRGLRVYTVADFVNGPPS